MVHIFKVLNLNFESPVFSKNTSSSTLAPLQDISDGLVSI